MRRLQSLPGDMPAGLCRASQIGALLESWYAVPDRFDLYNHAYRRHESDLYRQIRLSTYGRDFGQTSWVTTEESDAIPRLLQISAGSDVLEIGFGSGLYAIHLAEKTAAASPDWKSTHMRWPRPSSWHVGATWRRR
jgi:hypothetical protein